MKRATHACLSEAFPDESINVLRTLRLGLVAVALAAASFVGVVTPVVADQGLPGATFTPGSHLPTTHVTVKVDSRSDGVYLQITVNEDVPGNKGTEPSPQTTPQPKNVPTPPPQPTVPSSPSSTSVPDRIWSDDTGYHHQTSDGHLIYLTIPNLSSAIDWQSLLQAHPNQMPYTLYVDNQFQGIVWIPNSAPSQGVHFGPPPAQPAVPGNPPAGNGSSTDPYQVALDLLDHVPLPNIQLKMNPALGLVNLPGWFWVAGYDGKTFGTSRTVTIPPAVGPDVPFTDVPKNDPRRQPTSFTVSVTISASSYQWSFGDGANLVTQSLGQAYPAQSDIQHTYAFSSFQSPGGFPVSLTVVYNASYQVNGGPPQGLPPIAHTYTAAYPVQEAQTVLTRP